MTRPARVVIAAGGTGGHFYPGFVLAQTLRRRGWQPLMLARSQDPALERLEAAGIPSATLDLRGLPRRPGLGWAVFPWKLGAALGLASRILRDFGPKVVVGMGGYISFPAVAAARLRSIPCLVHESNAFLGLANRASVALGAGLCRGLPGGPGRVTGTPVRPELCRPASTDGSRRSLGLDPDRTTVLVFGGSQGAQGLNALLPPALARAATRCPGGLQVIHLSGAKSADGVRSAYAAAASLSAKVLPYLDAIDQAYAAADLVICRSGASTLAELAALRKPSLLVPYPHAAEGHQQANAGFFARAGAARVVAERDLGSLLEPALTELLCSSSAPQRRAEMSRAYGVLDFPCGEAAAEALADAVEQEARP